MSLDQKAAISRFRIAVATGALIWIGSISGCGSGDPFAYVPASGKVTYDDGTPIPAKRVHLVFLAENPPVIDEKTFALPGKADVTSSDGTFDTVTSHKYGDGLLPGKHKVQVLPLDDQNNPIEGLVPPEYGDAKKTPAEVDTANQPLVIKVPKPK